MRSRASSTAASKPRPRSRSASPTSTTASVSVSAVPRTDREIVNCAAYADGRRVADIALEEVGDYVANDGHFVWIGLHEPSEEVLKKIQAELGLHELAIE